MRLDDSRAKTSLEYRLKTTRTPINFMTSFKSARLLAAKRNAKTSSKCKSTRKRSSK